MPIQAARAKATRVTMAAGPVVVRVAELQRSVEQRQVFPAWPSKVDASQVFR